MQDSARQKSPFAEEFGCTVRECHVFEAQREISKVWRGQLLCPVNDCHDEDHAELADELQGSGPLSEVSSLGLA